MKRHELMKRPAAGGRGLASRLGIVLAASVVALVPSLCNAQVVAMDQVEKAVLAEDWEGAAQLLEGVSSDVAKSPDPVPRLVKGHVCLRLNRNNESVCLFLSVVTPEDLEACRLWAEKLVAGNENSAIARYFLGDVQSRLHKYPEAIATFTKGLQLKEGHPLIHNARGVAYAHNGQLARARVDFAEATNNPHVHLADAYANLGAFRIQRKDGAEAALEALNAALRVSPDFALALHERGCVRVVLKQTEDASKDFARALENAGCAAGMLSDDLLNCLAFTGTAPANRETIVRAIRENKLGTTFKTDLDLHVRMFEQQELNFLDRHNATVDIWDKFNSLPDEFKPPAMVDLKSAVEEHPAFGDPFTGITWNLHDNINDPNTGLAPRIFDTLSNFKILDSSIDLRSWEQNSLDNYENQGWFLREVDLDPGGVLASFKGSVFDDNEWPFTQLYGLAYDPQPVKPVLVAKKNVEETK